MHRLLRAFRISGELLIIRVLFSASASPCGSLTVKPKAHMFQELGEYQTEELGNPKDFWNYKDESFMGFIANLATSRGGPTSPTSVTQRVVERVRALSA